MTSSSLVATSFLVCGPWDQAGSSQANVTQRLITREEELEDMISVVAQTFLGLTVNCARCHSHKFDPIPQADYYRIKSVFEGVRHGERPILPPDELRCYQAALAMAKSCNETNQVQVPLPAPLPVSYAGVRKQPEPTHRLKRGDVRTPLEVVHPGRVLGGASSWTAILAWPRMPRKLSGGFALQRWLADARNPLTARVLVNRLWHFHFGQGIVATPNDFGAAVPSRAIRSCLIGWLANSSSRTGASKPCIA